MAKKEKTGTALRTTPAGKVQRANRDTQFNVRLSEQESERFGTAIILDAAMHGGDANKSQVVRRLINEFCRRVFETAASQEATEAAAVLRKRAR